MSALNEGHARAYFTGLRRSTPRKDLGQAVSGSRPIRTEYFPWLTSRLFAFMKLDNSRTIEFLLAIAACASLTYTTGHP